MSVRGHEASGLFLGNLCTQVFRHGFKTHVLQKLLLKPAFGVAIVVLLVFLSLHSPCPLVQVCPKS